MKKMGIFCMILCLSMVLSACNFSEYGALYDQEEKLMAQGDTYSFLGMVETNQSIEFRRFSGIYTLSTIHVETSISIDLSMEISSGRFKVIIVSDLDGIIELEEGINQLTLLDDQVMLRIVGDDAKGSISFTMET